MAEGPFDFSRGFRIGDRVRFLPDAEVSERLMALPAIVTGYDSTSRSVGRRRIDEVHVIVTVDVDGLEVEQWVAPAHLVTVH